jgi:hypothetical protein
VLEIHETKPVPYVPVSHPLIEQLIGAIRGEFLDHVLFRNTTDPERRWEEFR